MPGWHRNGACPEAGAHAWRYVGTEWVRRRRLIQRRECIHCGELQARKYRPHPYLRPFVRQG